MSREITMQSVEVNTLYIGALALDLILRDAERRMRAMGGEYKYEKKQMLTRFFKAVKEASVWAERLNDDVIESTEKSHFKDYNIWQAESNEPTDILEGEKVEVISRESIILTVKRK